MKNLIKIKCNKCDKTIAIKVEDKIEIKCDHCNEKNIVAKEIQFEDLTPHLINTP